MHQGAIEAIFLDSMRDMGLEVERPIVPTALELSADAALLADPNSYSVKATLKHLDAEDGETDTGVAEIVHAKYVVGADGAHSWVRKTMGITMDGEQTGQSLITRALFLELNRFLSIDYIWGVVDLVPETDFPDIRNRCAIHSNNGSCMIIPREGDKVRLYIQLGENDVVIDRSTGRVDKEKTKVGPEELLEVGRKSLSPYKINKVGEIDWWTIYLSKLYLTQFTKDLY